MEVKPGYKQTEVGVIPEEWDVKAFRELFAFRNGVNADKDSYGSGVRFINVLEPITYSHLHGPEIPGRVTLPEAVAASYAVRRGDVLFNRTSETESELGLAATYLGSERVVFGGFVIRGRPTDESFNPVYSGYALRAPAIRSQIIPMGQGAIRTNIGQQNLGQVVAPVPPPPEQCAIAEALSDVDGLLGGLDRLIAKKRDLKQAAMQQLLTGQTRLPGFLGEWEVKRLGELGEHVDGVPTTGGDLGYLEIGDVNVETKSYDVSQKEKLSVRGAVKVPAGTLLISTVRPTRGAIVITKSALYVSSAFCRVRPVNGLLFHLACQPKFLSYLGENSIGGTYPTCRDETIFGYESVLPSDPAEQIAIAEVLTEMDAELAALEQRREKTRALKQAMMQELLTGKTRLVTTGEAHA
jgi:type I restriction enzyme S subunit